MKLYDLIHEYKWVEIVPAMTAILPNDETFERNLAGHGIVFDELKELKPVNRDEMRLVIEWVVDDYDGQPYVDIYGLENRNEDASTHWGLGFMPWQEWLGLEIKEEDTLIPFTEQEIIAHCLWEMTFYGFSQETIQGSIAEVERTYADYKAGKLEAETFDSEEDFIVSLRGKLD